MRCPVCRAENTDATCRRCRADLSLLVRLEEQRRNALKSAQKAAAGQNPAALLKYAQSAHQLRAGTDSLQMLALGSLLVRDFPAALKRYREALAVSDHPAT